MTSGSATTATTASSGVCSFSGSGVLVDIHTSNLALSGKPANVIAWHVVLRTKFGPITIRVEDPNLKANVASFDDGNQLWVGGVVERFPNPKKPYGFYILLTADMVRKCKPDRPRVISFDVRGTVSGRSIATNRRKQNYMRRVVATANGEFICYFHRHKRKGWIIKVGDAVHFAGTVRTGPSYKKIRPTLLQFFHVEQVL
jgi:hypothetical protein